MPPSESYSSAELLRAVHGAIQSLDEVASARS
jgi:hypothetical protein